MSRTLLLAFLVTAAAVGQVNFDLQGAPCTYSPPTPCGTAGDAEGISWNGSAATNGLLHPAVDTVSGAGMPCSGTQFLRVPGSRVLAPVGLTTIPAGGPIPPAYSTTECYIPLPAGAVQVSFCWDFYSAEGANQGSFNDAAAIEIVGACGGAPLATLVYADTYTAGANLVPTGCPLVNFGTPREVAPAGVPQTVTNASIPTGGTHLRIRSANSGDNGYPSHMVIDNITFTLGVPGCVTTFTSPGGPGTVVVNNTPCPVSAGQNYFWAFTFAPGAFPAGNWFGLDIGFAQLVNWYQSGAPFVGGLDGTGASSISASGLPSGLQFWQVTTVWAPGFGALVTSYPPVTYTIP